MKKTVFLSIILILWLIGSVESGERLGFRGIYLGMDAEQASYAAEKCRDEGMDIAAMYINSYFIPNIKDNPRPIKGEKVENITVYFGAKESGYDEAPSEESIIKTIRKKYGKPSFHKKEIYHNGFGATFFGFQEYWELKDGVVILEYTPAGYLEPKMTVEYRIWSNAYDAKKQTESNKRPKL